MIPNGERVVYLTDRFGHAIGQDPVYFLRVPRQAVGADVIYFDVWNGSADKYLKLLRCEAFVQSDTAVTGLVGIRALLCRTSAVGTGGTTAVEASTTNTIFSINRTDARDPALSTLEPLITARLTPTGGATAASTFGEGYLSPEETSSASFASLELCPRSGLYVAPGVGFRVYQGAVASVAAVGFNVEFEVGRVGL